MQIFNGGLNKAVECLHLFMKETGYNQPLSESNSYTKINPI